MTELSREAILAMSTYELNLAVAEHIYGWIAWTEERGEFTYVLFQKPGNLEPYRRSQRWESMMHRYKQINYSEINPYKQVVTSLKEWSTDISAAWEIVEKLRGQQIYIEVLAFEDDYEVMARRVVEKAEDCMVMAEVEAKTAPEAICKAALLTTLEEESR